MKVGLAISGGANKGSWAEGVVTAIEEKHGDEFSLIAGTSIGGVVGACLANRMPQDERWRWWESMTWGKVSNPVFPPGIAGMVGSAFFTDRKMKRIFRELFPPIFKMLELPLAISACNLLANVGEESNLIFTSGDLHKALLATVAIPGVFPPVEMGDKLLVDGGIGNYIPLEIFKGFDLVYAVMCGYGTPSPPPKTAIEIIWRSFEMAVQEEISREVRMFDDTDTKLVVIMNSHPEIANSSMFNWLDGREWLRMGYNDGLKALKE